jgi:plasmid stabilization system protein ParE
VRVRFTPRAGRDLETVLQYIDEQSPRGARNVKRAIQKTIELIGEFPEGGRLAGEQAVRVLPAGRYPYLIYWSIKAGEAWIIHVRHAQRRAWEGGPPPNTQDIG